MKKFLLTILAVFVIVSLTSSGCSKKGDEPKENNQEEKPKTEETTDTATQNLNRAITLADAAFENYFEGSAMEMSRYYNPYTEEKSSEKGSIWMYTSAIEATVAVMEALELQLKNGDKTLYDRKYSHFNTILSKLYEGAKYYRGSYSLTSFTGTSNWSPYAVNRSNSPETADVTGVLNVYDDQMWLVREFIGAYKVTGESKYLKEAEYLTSYILDGWDCTLKDGKERGGIPWGPGYYSKHACSNGPMISPLVWLAEIYSGKSDKITYKYIDSDGKTRKSEEKDKSEYYLMFAKKIYDWSKENLMYTSGNEQGLYIDNLNGPTIGSTIQYEEVDGTTYRKPADLNDHNGPAYSYNAGTMISGAADLYRITSESEYLTDMKALSDKSFSYFAKKGTVKTGLYTYDITGFNNWFNGVLLRGFIDANTYYSGANEAVESFQNNLDYAWTNYLYKDMLPSSLLAGWKVERSKNNIEGMFTFAFASEYAILSQRLIKNK